MLRTVLAELKGRTTLVLVSHRPSLLQLADELYEIKDGILVHRAARARLKPPPQHGDTPAQTASAGSPASNSRVSA